MCIIIKEGIIKVGIILIIEVAIVKYIIIMAIGFIPEWCLYSLAMLVDFTYLLLLYKINVEYQHNLIEFN